MIDLHTHTTASDGRCSPQELVSRAAAAGVTTLGVTDHDTVSGCADAAVACAAASIQFVPGIEITAVLDRADVHILGYFVDPQAPAFLGFLAEQRRRRADRVREIIARLTALGMPLDADVVLAPGVTENGRSAGRPWVARALVAAGFVDNTNAAFERWLGRGRPAFVPRVGLEAPAVVEQIHRANGLSSLAHPGLTGIDEWIPEFVDAGLDAIEAYHTRHDAAITARYLRMADTLHVLVTGGSDFHGDNSHGPVAPGAASLPKAAFERLVARVR